MSCNVMPLKKYAEINYRVKCVAVESERVLGDIYVTKQTRNLAYDAEGYHFPAAHNRRKKRNLIQKTLEGPDFMAMNRKKQIRRLSVIPVEVTPRRSIRRSKSVGEEGRIILVEDDVKNSKTTYPPPLPNPPAKEEVVSSLVDRLLLDIYGLPAGDRTRSESDSTALSLRTRPQHQYLQKTRLLWKSRDELQVLVLNLREHISHTGSILIRQLRRKDYLSIKRDKQFDIITAHLQAHSAKRMNAGIYVAFEQTIDFHDTRKAQTVYVAFPVLAPHFVSDNKTVPIEKKNHLCVP